MWAGTTEAEKEMKYPNSKLRMTIFPKTVIRSVFQNKMAIQDAPKTVKEDASICKRSLAPQIINYRDRKPERAQQAFASACYPAALFALFVIQFSVPPWPQGRDVTESVQKKGRDMLLCPSGKRPHPQFNMAGCKITRSFLSLNLQSLRQEASRGSLAIH